MEELCVEPGDFPSGDTIGFMNVVIWATDSDTAATKLTHYLATFQWTVIGVEETIQVDQYSVYAEEMGDMIDRARLNDEAIILGTFHTYRPN
jgi:hypothetical protein